MKTKIKQTLSIFMAIVLLLCITPVASFAASETTHKTGLIWSNWDSINAPIYNATVNSSSLPKSVDLTSKFPVPGNQGNQSSCVAWAVGYSLVSGQQMTRRNWSRTSSAHLFSPAYIYNQTNGGIDAGSTIESALTIVTTKGVCSLNYFPYDDSNCTTQPTALQNAAASMYKAVSWGKISGIDQMKDRLAKGDGVIIGVEVYPDFDRIGSSNQVYDTVSGKSRGGHAICLIGYDDTKGAFKFINSWGTGWGLNGYGWISYKLVSNSTVNRSGSGNGFILNKATSDDYILGDVNGDGKVTATDARLVLRYSSKLENYTVMQAALADADGNGTITQKDSQYILKYSSRLISNLPLYD